MTVPDCPECGGSTPEGLDPDYAHTEECSQHPDYRSDIMEPDTLAEARYER